jgi:predicted SAM-dependent methyltransferase
VLEHVADDRKAMREFYRTLAPGGWALILVPQSSRAVTDEDNTLTDPAERQRRFGQHHHVRLYGQDFHERLSQAGFRIQVFTTEDLASPVEFAQYGLTRNERLFLCRR